MGHLSIIGDKKQPFAVTVQTAHGKQAPMFLRQQLRNKMLGVPIAQGSRVSTRLIQCQVDRLFPGYFNRPSVQRQSIFLRIGAGTQADSLAVNRHAALGDPFLRLAARSQSRLLKNSLHPHPHGLLFHLKNDFHFHRGVKREGIGAYG